MADTTISWSEKTWNPVVGCSKVSEGCRNCYAMRVAYGLERRFRQEKYAGTTKRTPRGPQWTGLVRTAPEALELPLRWRKPAKVFVNSMSDLFHEAVPFEFVAAVFGVMAATPRHTYQVLTKRPARMLEFFRWLEAVNPAGLHNPAAKALWFADDHIPATVARAEHRWPLPNVWLGASVEDQAAADGRVPLLLQAPAAVRWLSMEPLLGPVDLERVLWPGAGGHRVDVLRGGYRLRPGVLAGGPSAGPGEPKGGFVNHSGVPGTVDWVVVGGESGPLTQAREFRLEWAADLVRQCKGAGVPVFVKQLGSQWARLAKARDPKGEDMGEWPAWPPEIHTREWPSKPRESLGVVAVGVACLEQHGVVEQARRMWKEEE